MSNLINFIIWREFWKQFYNRQLCSENKQKHFKMTIVVARLSDFRCLIELKCVMWEWNKLLQRKFSFLLKNVSMEIASCSRWQQKLGYNWVKTRHWNFAYSLIFHFDFHFLKFDFFNYPKSQRTTKIVSAFRVDKQATIIMCIQIKSIWIEVQRSMWIATSMRHTHRWNF